MSTGNNQNKSLWSRILDKVQPFLIGGFSGIVATCIIQPTDMLKVQIQIESEILGKKGGMINPIKVIRDIYNTGGIRRFYAGLDSAIARQICYKMITLGTYKTLFEKLKARNQGKEIPLIQKVLASSTAALIGAFSGNPADLILIRMQADVSLPVENRRNYTNVFNACARIVREEGFTALWRGSVPTMVRAVMLNLGMLATYDQAKEKLNQYRGEEKSNRFYAAAVSGFFSAFFSLPFDNAKTKMQKMKVLTGQEPPYKNIFHAISKTARQEGFTGLYSGFATFYFRIAPYVMLTLLIQDYVTDKVKQWRGQD